MVNSKLDPLDNISKKDLGIVFMRWFVVVWLHSAVLAGHHRLCLTGSKGCGMNRNPGVRDNTGSPV